MSLSKAIEILDEHNRWRRNSIISAMIDPKELGKAIDVVVEHYKKQKELMNTEEDSIRKGAN